MPTLKHTLAVLTLLAVIVLGTPGNASSQTFSTGVAVLVFHQVAPGATGKDTMSPQDFEKTLTNLLEAGYVFIDLPTMHNYLNGTTTVASKSVLVTFDDGYQGVYTYAHPILKKLNVPAVMFPIAMYYQPGYKLPPRFIPHLSRDEIKTMLAAGLWGLGGHSFDGHHQIITSPGHTGAFLTSYAWLGQREETDQEYYNRVNADVVAMTRILQSLGATTPLDFAAPTNNTNSTLQEILSANGYRYIYLQGKKLNYPGSSIIYRVTAVNPDQVLQDLNTLFTYENIQPNPVTSPSNTDATQDQNAGTSPSSGTTSKPGQNPATSSAGDTTTAPESKPATSAVTTQP